MKLLWLTLLLVISRKACPHWDSLYCNCASDRRRNLASRIQKELHDHLVSGKGDWADEMNAVLNVHWGTN